MADNTSAYNPATQTGESSASGNPGANNPGVEGNVGAQTRGVKTDTDVNKGFVNPGNVGTEASSVLGAGGLSGAGLREIDPDSAEEDEVSDILANTGTPGTANSPTANGTDPAGMGGAGANLPGMSDLAGQASLTSSDR